MFSVSEEGERPNPEDSEGKEVVIGEQESIGVKIDRITAGIRRLVHTEATVLPHELEPLKDSLVPQHVIDYLAEHANSSQGEYDWNSFRKIDKGICYTSLRIYLTLVNLFEVVGESISREEFEYYVDRVMKKNTAVLRDDAKTRATRILEIGKLLSTDLPLGRSTSDTENTVLGLLEKEYNVDLELAAELSPKGLWLYLLMIFRHDFDWSRKLEWASESIAIINENTDEDTKLQSRFKLKRVIEAIADSEDEEMLIRKTHWQVMKEPDLVIAPAGFCIDHVLPFLALNEDYVRPGHELGVSGTDTQTPLKRTQYGIVNVGSTEDRNSQPIEIRELDREHLSYRELCEHAPAGWSVTPHMYALRAGAYAYRVKQETDPAYVRLGNEARMDYSDTVTVLADTYSDEGEGHCTVARYGSETNRFCMYDAAASGGGIGDLNCWGRLRVAITADDATD